MAGPGQIIQRRLEGPGEIREPHGHLARVPRFHGQPVGHDLGSRLHAEQGAQLEEKVRRSMRIGRLAQLAEFYRAAPPPVSGEEFVG